ncbi:hypothetical protein D3C81_169960 [compost metagenome]
MPYKDLYEFAQGLEPVVNRNAIRDKILELTGASGFRFFRHPGLDKNKLAGMYVHPGNLDHQFSRQAQGKHVVALAYDLNRCWDRFVSVKEMMHLFDDDLEKANTEDDFDSIIDGLFDEAFDGQMSPQCVSEIRCFWMAVGVLCPERIRSELHRKRDAGEMTDLEIAEYLKVPAAYIGSFCSPNIKKIMQRLIS